MAASGNEGQAPAERPAGSECAADIETGELARDTERDQVGVVLGRDGPHYRLRPVRGGTEWNVRSEALLPVKASDLLREKVRQANRRSLGGSQ